MPINTMISLDTITPSGMLLDVAARVKQRRLELDLTQEGLAQRAGVKLPTYRKFESTGVISFEKLLQIAFALNCLRDFERLFSERQFSSLEEVANAQAAQKRKRGKKQ